MEARTGSLVQEHASMREDVLQRLRRRCSPPPLCLGTHSSRALPCLPSPEHKHRFPRDRSEKRPYEDLVKSHARLQQECKVSVAASGVRGAIRRGASAGRLWLAALHPDGGAGVQQRERTHLQMSQQMSIQTEELRELRESSGKEGGGGRCTKCSQMQDELTRNLREKADDKQQIIQLESVVRKLQAQLAKAEAAANEAQVNAREQQQSITEKDAKIEDMHQNIQVLTEEVASRTIELHELRPQLRRADAENQQLISQLLTIKEGIADKYNEINEMQQEAERIKRSAELMAAAKSLEAPAPPADTGDVSPGEMVSARLSMRGLAFGCQVPTAPRRAVVAHERNEIHSLAHNSSGAMVLTGSDDRSLKLWDTRNGTRLAALEGAVKGVMSVGFSDDGKHVLGASNDFAVRIWSLKSQRVLHVLTGHQNKIYCAAFSPDSTLVYSGGWLCSALAPRYLAPRLPKCLAHNPRGLVKGSS
jgi:hypothetical protein